MDNYYLAKFLGFTINGVFEPAAVPALLDNVFPFGGEDDYSIGIYQAISDSMGSSFYEYTITQLPGTAKKYTFKALHYGDTINSMRLLLNDNTTVVNVPLNASNCAGSVNPTDTVIFSGKIYNEEDFLNGVHNTNVPNSKYGCKFSGIPADAIFEKIKIDGDPYDIKLVVTNTAGIAGKLNLIGKGNYTVTYTGGAFTVLKNVADDYCPEAMELFWTESNQEINKARMFELLATNTADIEVTDIIQTAETQCIVEDESEHIISTIFSYCGCLSQPGGCNDSDVPAVDPDPPVDPVEGFPIYWGVSNTAELTEFSLPGVLSGFSTIVQTTVQGEFNYGPTGYKYFISSVALGLPTSFFEMIGNFPMAMSSPYILNYNGDDYYVFRSNNVLNGIIKLKVT